MKSKTTTAARVLLGIVFFKYREVNCSRMAYIDEGDGDAIVFQHGQPTSSYVWRNIMPHLEGMGRLVACDLIGMGGSDKLDPSLGPDRYRLANHRRYLYDLWDQLDLGNRVLLVLDDWGAVLGFDWGRHNSERVRSIVHMEAVPAPLDWPDIPEEAHPLFKALRSPEGERLVLQENIFIEKILPQAVLRQLTGDELNTYRQQYYDNHPILFSDGETSLKQGIRFAEMLANGYNRLKGALLSWTAIDLAALQSSIKAQVPAAVEEQVARAKAKTLRALGEWKEACEVEKPYVLANFEKLRSSRSGGAVCG